MSASFYSFPPNWIKGDHFPRGIEKNEELSERDKMHIVKLYGPPRPTGDSGGEVTRPSPRPTRPATGGRYVYISMCTFTVHTSLHIRMKNLRYHFPTCYAYSVTEPIGELNLKRALDEDTGVFSSFFSLLSSSSPLGQTAISENSTLHQ